MNRRKFFAGIAAVVTAACVPASSDYRHILERAGYPFRKGAGFIASRYGSTHAWWSPKYGVATFPKDMRQLEARTLASLQAM